MRRARIPAATAGYILTLGGVAAAPLSEVAGIGETATIFVTGACVLAVHIGYGAVARTYWACAVCLVLPIAALLLAPDDPDMPNFPLTLAYGLAFVAPWVAGLIGTGVALRELHATRAGSW